MRREWSESRYTGAVPNEWTRAHGPCGGGDGGVRNTEEDDVGPGPVRATPQWSVDADLGAAEGEGERPAEPPASDDGNARVWYGRHDREDSERRWTSGARC